MTTQRTTKDSLSAERRQRLEAVPGWVWDTLADQWDTNFHHLTEFSNREGHCQVPKNYQTEGGVRLGLWVSNQRANQDNLSADKREKLEALTGWVWDVLEYKWRTGFRYLMGYLEREGDCLVPQSFQTGDGYRLGLWVSHQRVEKDRLTTEQREMLKALPGWVWDRVAEKWEVGFRHLLDFAKSEGHCQVPRNALSADGYRVGQWLRAQRGRWGALPTERKERLRALSGWNDPL